MIFANLILVVYSFQKKAAHMDHIPFLNSQKEYPTDMAIQISKTPIIIVNIMVSSSQIPAIPSKATKMPPIIKSFPPNRCVRYQFSSLHNVQGNLMPIV